MAEIVIHCIPEAGTDPAEAYAEMDAFLRDTEGLEPVLVEVEKSRGVGLAEILAIVQVAQGIVDLTGKLIAYIKSRQGKAEIKDIEIEIDGQRVPVGNLTPDQRARLDTALAQGA